jgi:hypothetical protein
MSAGRRKTFDLAAKRRREIVLHARLVGAADTEDFSRWPIAWVWHNRKAKDQIWSVMECARNMGRAITEAEARAIIEEAAITRRHYSADNLARFLGVTYEQRRQIGLTTIGSVDVSKRNRRNLRRWRNRLAHEGRRRALGVRLRAEYEVNSLSRTKPWQAEGMSRRTWYRRRGTSPSTAILILKSGGTSPSAPCSTIGEDRPVPPERKLGHPSRNSGRRGRKPKEQDAGGEMSSQTAATMVADRFEGLALELRFMALGLPIPGEFEACEKVGASTPKGCARS